jgi:hypothetical protein
MPPLRSFGFIASSAFYKYSAPTALLPFVRWVRVSNPHETYLKPALSLSSRASLTSSQYGGT